MLDAVVSELPKYTSVDEATMDVSTETGDFEVSSDDDKIPDDEESADVIDDSVIISLLPPAADNAEEITITDDEWSSDDIDLLGSDGTSGADVISKGLEDSSMVTTPLADTDATFTLSEFFFSELNGIAEVEMLTTETTFEDDADSKRSTVLVLIISVIVVDTTPGEYNIVCTEIDGFSCKDADDVVTSEISDKDIVSYFDHISDDGVIIVADIGKCGVPDVAVENVSKVENDGINK